MWVFEPFGNSSRPFRKVTGTLVCPRAPHTQKTGFNRKRTHNPIGLPGPERPHEVLCTELRSTDAIRQTQTQGNGPTRVDSCEIRDRDRLF